MADPINPDARLLALVEAYGSEPAHWPEADRTAAHLARLADPGPRLAAAIETADRLDGLLDGLAAPAPSSALTGAVLASAPRASLRHRLAAWLPPRSAWLPTSGALAGLVIGLVIGLDTAVTHAGLSDPDAEDEILYAALGYGDLLDTFSEGTP